MDVLGPVFAGDEFARAFPAVGRPVIAPGTLALVPVLQYTEGLSDRQAADQVRARMDWTIPGLTPPCSVTSGRG